MLSPYATVVEKLHRDVDKEKITMLKIERAGDVLADAVSNNLNKVFYKNKNYNYNFIKQPAKVAQAVLLFCKGQGLLTSVVMPGVDRSRAFSTSSGGSNDGQAGPNRRLSRGMSMEEYDKPNIRRLSVTVNNDNNSQLPPVKK